MGDRERGLAKMMMGLDDATLKTTLIESRGIQHNATFSEEDRRGGEIMGDAARDEIVRRMQK